MRRLAFIALLLAGCASAPRPPIDLVNANVIDLTYPFDKNTLYWPNSPSGFELKQLAFGKTPAGYFYASNSFCAPEHGGTHLDAPIHFAHGALTADQIPVRQLIAPAAVIEKLLAVTCDRIEQLELRSLGEVADVKRLLDGSTFPALRHFGPDLGDAFLQLRRYSFVKSH